MTPKKFLANFATLAHTPKAVAKLRELILQLAVQGKLIPQNSNDRPSPLAKEDESAVSDDLPCGWAEAPLGEVARLRRGFDLPKGRRNPGTIPVFAANGPVGVHDEVRVLAPGVVTGRSGTIGKVHYVPHDFWPLNTALYVENFHGNDPEFITLLLRSVDLKQFGSHTAVPTLNRNVAHKALVWVPPLSEQRRIVSRVAGLMALCDELEEKWKKRVSVRVAAGAAAIDKLLTARDDKPFAKHWTRIRDHFCLLYDTPKTVAQLRQAILQLAVQGKLVPQDPTDEPIDVLLGRIAAETAQLVKERKVRKSKPLSPIAPHELPFDLPNGWQWIQAQHACKPLHLITYGILKPVWVDDGVPTVRVKDMKNGEIVTDAIAHCSPDRADKFLKTTLRARDLLIAKDGATLGKTAFVPPSLDGGNITQHVLRFPIREHLSRLYIRLVVDAPHGQAWMGGETKGVALPGVNVGDFRRMPIPLPPIAEQNRIVGKVDQVMALCDGLEEKLKRSERDGEKLMAAAVYGLLHGTIAGLARAS